MPSVSSSQTLRYHEAIAELLRRQHRIYVYLGTVYSTVTTNTALRPIQMVVIPDADSQQVSNVILHNFDPTGSTVANCITVGIIAKDDNKPAFSKHCRRMSHRETLKNLRYPKTLSSTPND